MDKKNLDELFRAKFKTFREVPDEKVWTAIENSLDKKRKKRIIPLWWQLGGVAAVLTVALFTFYTLKDSGDETPVISNTEKTNSNDTKQDGLDADSKKDVKEALQLPEVTEDAVVNSSGDTDLKNTDKYPASEFDGVSGSEKSSGIDKSKKQEDALQILEANKDAPLANIGKEGANKNTDKDSDPKTDKDSFQNKLPNTNVADTDATSPKDKSTKDSGTRSPEKTQLARNELDSNREIADRVAVQGNPNIISEKSDRAMAQTDQIGKDGTRTDGNKKSIFEALEEQAEDEKIVEEPSSRWSAGPNVAPVYFNAMGEGSPIDPGFSPNAKSGSTNLSYGVSIAYAVTEKLSVRSGIHKAEYGYNTNNIGFSPTLAASTNGRLQNINFAGGPGNLAEISPNSNLDSPNDLAPEFSSLNSARDGTIAQSFGYLEVPLELDYALIDRRFGVNLVGGISSLFLIDNSVTLNSGELTTEIGEARNLNDLNFSTNIGFGVNYKFTPKVQLNIEPVFKYQLNTFSNVSGDFRPFSIGVYSGLNFKF